MAKHDDHDREIPMPQMSLALLNLARDIFIRTVSFGPPETEASIELSVHLAFLAAEAFMQQAVERGALGPPEKT